MSLDLEPVDYLRMLKEEYNEYRHGPEIVRKAINCCALSNALPEIIFAKFGFTEPQKVHGAKSLLHYREHLRRECDAHHSVRDICDFSKHGPGLSRSSVSVRDTKLIRRVEGYIFGLLTLKMTLEVERLVITHQDGRTELMGGVLKQVVDSWDMIFARDGL
jgi:hypothetical protein